MVSSKLSTILKNRVLLYMFTRYIVYAIQFIAFLLIANRLGPHHYGRWGFFVMIYGYFNVVNFGIPHSLNVLLVQNKTDEIKTKNYVMSSFAALVIMSFFVFILAVLYSIRPLPVFSKYNMGILFYVICFFAVLYYANIIFTTIYRFKNRLFELTIHQSLFPLLIFLSSFLFSGEFLFYVLILDLAVSQIVSLLIYLCKGAVPFGGHIYSPLVLEIFKKGFFLFLYNSCFYLILTTTSTIISYYYSVEEYGLYTFSYSLGHSILLLLEAFAYIILPKIIDKFYTGSIDETKNVLNSIRINYVVLSHGLMYIAFLFFPTFISFFPKYHDALPALCLTALAVLLSTNAFGYNGYLIAKNDEKHIARISVFSLIINVIIGVVICLIKAPFYYVVICMMISYLVFTCMCSVRATKFLGENFIMKNFLSAIFPIGLLIPFVLGLFIVFFKMYEFSFIPFLCYCIMNVSNIKSIMLTLKEVALRPTIIDIK